MSQHANVNSQPWGDALIGMTHVKDSTWRDEKGRLWIWTEFDGWLPGYETTTQHRRR